MQPSIRNLSKFSSKTETMTKGYGLGSFVFTFGKNGPKKFYIKIDKKNFFQMKPKTSIQWNWDFGHLVIFLHFTFTFIYIRNVSMFRWFEFGLIWMSSSDMVDSLIDVIFAALLLFVICSSVLGNIAMQTEEKLIYRK